MSEKKAEYNQSEVLSAQNNNINIIEYNSNRKLQWNDFINTSKNGVFLFNRDYMEYHADRFEDFSLMFFEKNKLIAVMPTNIENKTVYSHAGLTFGGIISNNKINTPKMLEIFKTLKEFLKSNGVEKLIYKAIPYIYHSVPSDEDLYALFRNNAKLIRRDVSSCVCMDKICFNRCKNRNIKKCKELRLEVKRDYDFEGYMALKREDLLKKYGIKPVHTGKEIKLLAEKFPENIKLFTVRKDEELLAGTIIYEDTNIAHAQYLASTDYGKKLFATDLLFNYLINDYFRCKKYFDFGISTEDKGNYLNEGLILFKEGFGARAITHDFYEIEL